MQNPEPWKPLPQHEINAQGDRRGNSRGPSFSNISSYSMIFPLVKSHFADWNMGIFASSFTSLATIADYRYVSLPEGNHDQPW